VITIGPDTFVVFDLDDTLYEEDQYHDSGLNAVASFVLQVYGKDVSAQLAAWKRDEISDLWGRLSSELRIAPVAKEAFLWTYRLHRPAIRLTRETSATFERVAKACAGVAILTDGRSATQRLKLAALGLDGYPVYISEEWQSEKPDHARFLEIARKFRAVRYVYVGDNPRKDFKAPNELGWLTIGVRGNRRNVHSQCVDDLPSIYHPSLWVTKFNNLCEFLC